VPMEFQIDTLGTYHAMVSVYRNDGTVVIVHGGVENGQGINTKVSCLSLYYDDTFKILNYSLACLFFINTIWHFLMFSRGNCPNPAFSCEDGHSNHSATQPL
jgi:hypothetical protein